MAHPKTCLGGAKVLHSVFSDQCRFFVARWLLRMTVPMSFSAACSCGNGAAERLDAIAHLVLDNIDSITHEPRADRGNLMALTNSVLKKKTRRKTSASVKVEEYIKNALYTGRLAPRERGSLKVTSPASWV